MWYSSFLIIKLYALVMNATKSSIFIIILTIFLNIIYLILQWRNHNVYNGILLFIMFDVAMKTFNGIHTRRSRHQQTPWWEHLWSESEQVPCVVWSPWTNENAVFEQTHFWFLQYGLAPEQGFDVPHLHDSETGS